METKSLKVDYIRERYEALIKENKHTKSCLSSVVVFTYILQGFSTVLGLTLTAIPSIEGALNDFKFILIGLAAANSLVSGIIAVLTQLERRKKTVIEHNTKAITKMLGILDDNEVTRSELETVIELDKVDK